MNIYFISGLGADQRIFQKLQLPEIFNLFYIEWVPVNEKESIQVYCRRLSGQIDLEQPFSLIGVSFGGIIAIELSKIISPVQTVIISSFSSKTELSTFYLFINKCKLHRLIPTRLLLKPNSMIFRIFGVINPDGKTLLRNILKDTDPKFFRWAINQLFAWENEWKPSGFLHIHGTADKILPFHERMNAIRVEGGEHLMVYSKADEISRLLENNLSKV